MSLNQRKVDRRGRQQEWIRLSELHAARHDRPAADPLGAGATFFSRLDQKLPVTVWGRVVDAIPYTNAYKVQPERGLPTTICTYMGSAGNGAIGARSVTTIPPGAQVLFLYYADINYGLIFAVEPAFMTDPDKALSDFIFQGSRSGLWRDPAHSVPFLMNTRGVADWSAGRPFDATTAGEWGAFTETGLRVFLDSRMAMVAAGEATGLFVFYRDQLTRLAGVNVQLRSMGAERDILLDEGEILDVDRSFIFPWEALGAGRQGQTLHQDRSSGETQIESPWYGATEPAHDDQFGIPRLMQFRGYLGQGGRRILQAPTTSSVNRLSSGTPLVALWSEDVTLTGQHILRSAKGITIAKTPLIPTIRQRRLPEDKAGDGTGYRASGAYGSGPSHNLKATLVQPSGSSPNAAALAGARDRHAYMFNFEAPHAVHMHAKDWETAEASKNIPGNGTSSNAGILGQDVSNETGAVQFDQLRGNRKQYLPPPQTRNLSIDHRYGNVQYSLASSFFDMADDGSISLLSGYGGAVVLGPDGVSISGPDVSIRAGRNANVWAGRDVIIRGANNVEASASNGSFRAKGQKHCWLLANQGLALIESRGRESDLTFREGGRPLLGDEGLGSGVVLRAPNAPIVEYGRHIYLRTGGGEIANGVIVLDAGRGTSQLLLNVNNQIMYAPMGGGRYDAFMQGETVRKVHAFSANNVLLDGDTQTIGGHAVLGTLLVDGWLYSNRGHIATGVGNQHVFAIEAGAITPYFNEVRAAEKSIRNSLSQYFGTVLTQQFYAERKPGHAEVMIACAYSFRPSLECGTQGTYHIYEDHWQQMAREGGGGQIWEEQTITTQGLPNAPFPGFDTLISNGSYFEMPATMVQADGSPRDRGTPDAVPGYYADPKYGTPVAKTLGSGYRIIG